MERIILWNLRKPIIHRFLDKLNLKAIGMLALVLMLQSVSIETFAQNLSITGKVTDDSGAGIPGASVLIKGTTLGTATNFDGVYTLSDVPADATLVFSFIGMLAEELQVEGRTTIDIMLTPDLIGLDEVVVVGYGTMRKADLTGSVSTVNNEDLVKAGAANITSTLTGKMTGVITRQTSGRPGADSPSFKIRGKSTFGNNDALVLVDGIERDFNRIDPNDIESITVLKDAASAAIYGSRGANGVILVTTRRGGETEPSINYSGSYSMAAPTFLPEYMNATNYATYLNEAKINKGQPATFTDEQIEQYRSGEIPTTDWWNEVMSKNAPMQQHNLSATGGTKATKYFMSLGFLDQAGLYETSNYKRYNVRSNIDSKISKNLSVSLDIAARKDETGTTTISEDKMYQTLLTAVPTNPAYVPAEFRVQGDELGLNFNGTAGSPIGEAIHSGYNRSGNSFLESKLGAKYNFGFIEGLSAQFDYSYDKKFYNSKVFNTPYILNFYTRENGLTLSAPSTNNTTLTQKSEEASRKTVQASLNYSQTFGEHTFGGMFLFEQMDYRMDNIQAYREQYLSSALDYLFAGSDLNKDNTGKAEENARQGYVGRFNYNYSNKYLFQANARYDGSYNFPEEGRWGLFPAFSAGWRISEEAFMAGAPIISNLKIRGSWGQFGNDKVEPFYYLSGYEYSYGAMIGSSYRSGIRDTGLANENITWETATNLNIGIDFGILNGKISGEFDYFTKETEGILIARNASVPQTFGADLPKENLGIVNNHGVEAILRYQDSFGEVNFGAEANVTYATSEVKYIDEPAEVEDRIKQTGRPFDSQFGYGALGLFQTQEEIDTWADQDGNNNKSIKPGDIKYFDYNNDSIIDGNDIHYIGRGSDPELVFGFNLNSSYKNFSLLMNFQGAAKYTRYLYLDSFDKDYNTYSVLTDSWREGNEGAAYPRLEPGRSYNNNGGWNGRKSTFWMHEGFYIKLRNISLSYSIIDNTYLESIGIENIILSASATNLLTIAKKDGFDPEGTNNRYPIMRTVSFGVNVTF